MPLGEASTCVLASQNVDQEGCVASNPKRTTCARAPPLKPRATWTGKNCKAYIFQRLWRPIYARGTGENKEVSGSHNDAFSQLQQKKEQRGST